MYAGDPPAVFYDKSRTGLAPHLFEGSQACAAARLTRAVLMKLRR